MTVDGKGEAQSFAMPEHTSSTSGSGITLPHRPSSVTIHRRVSLSDDGPNRDSLDETRAFVSLPLTWQDELTGSTVYMAPRRRVLAGPSREQSPLTRYPFAVDSAPARIRLAYQRHLDPHLLH